MTSILGINAFHGDAAACIIIDGKLIAAVEEERFNRIKHWAGFPVASIRFCMSAAGIDLRDLDHIAINRNPNANLLKKITYTLKNRPKVASIKDRMLNSSKVKDVKVLLSEQFNIAPAKIKAELHYVEHHLAHLASSFYVSPYEKSVVVSLDGFGDFVSSMWGVGEGNEITVLNQVNFPHSLGLLYLAFTQFLGFNNYGDEYKVMGLAGYGTPSKIDQMHQLVDFKENGQFELNLDFFQHHSAGISMVWENGSPKIDRVYSDHFETVFGRPRKSGDPLTKNHYNIAASVQQIYETGLFNLVNFLHSHYHLDTLCLSGGCALNSLANGRLFNSSKFRQIFIPPSPGDSGGAIGSAVYVLNNKLKKKRSLAMGHAFWGPAFTDPEIKSLLCSDRDLDTGNFVISKMTNQSVLCQEIAKKLTEGKVVGWFQGRMEWGPRALGNRSILCDPRLANMKDILNEKIKRRESFRPFAPAILREAVLDWFESDMDVPFMLKILKVKNEKQDQIPAVVHVDGTARLQTVSELDNPLFYELIQSFSKLTDIPMLLNTSFNENEPIVCRPEEALTCFKRTKMDILVLGNWMVERIS